MQPRLGFLGSVGKQFSLPFPRYDASIVKLLVTLITIVFFLLHHLTRVSNSRVLFCIEITRSWIVGGPLRPLSDTWKFVPLLHRRRLFVQQHKPSLNRSQDLFTRWTRVRAMRKTRRACSPVWDWRQTLGTRTEWNISKNGMNILFQQEPLLTCILSM